MTRNRSALTATCLTVLCAFFCGLQPAQASDNNVYKKMADDIAKFSKVNKVKSIAVLAFTRKAKTSREESEYVSEKLLTCLAESGEVKLLERSQLDKVLQEQKLGLAGLTQGEEKKDSGISSADVIIIGVVFGTADHLKIIAKMIDPGTGAVLHITEAQTERQWDMVEEKSGFEFDVPDMTVIAGMFGEEASLPGFSDYRDAPASPEIGNCAARRNQLIARQASAVEAKAKYWTLRMLDSEFSNDALTKNPGAEIVDPRMKKTFYALLDTMYKAPEPPRMSSTEEQQVKSLMDEERTLTNECGQH